MARALPHLPVVAASLLLAACQTTNDPSKGGFLSGVSALSSGAYEQRQAEKKLQLEDSQDEKTRREQEVRRLSAQQADVSQRRAAAEQQLAALNVNLGKLRDRLAQSKRNNAALQQQVTALERRVKLAESNPYLDDAEREQQLAALRKEQASLEQQIDLALQR